MTPERTKELLLKCIAREAITWGMTERMALVRIQASTGCNPGEAKQLLEETKAEYPRLALLIHDRYRESEHW